MSEASRRHPCGALRSTEGISHFSVKTQGRLESGVTVWNRVQAQTPAAAAGGSGSGFVPLFSGLPSSSVPLQERLCVMGLWAGQGELGSRALAAWRLCYGADSPATEGQRPGSQHLLTLWHSSSLILILSCQKPGPLLGAFSRLGSSPHWLRLYHQRGPGCCLPCPVSVITGSCPQRHHHMEVLCGHFLPLS